MFPDEHKERALQRDEELREQGLSMNAEVQYSNSSCCSILGILHNKSNCL